MLTPNTGRKRGIRESQHPSDGINLDDLAEGAVIEIETQHHHYRLVKDTDTHVHISGHPTFCPEPVEVEVEGSIERGQPPRTSPHYIGRGMRLVLRHPQFDVFTTSRIQEIHRG